MTRCEECGARNAAHGTFCVRCGADLAHGDERSVGEDTDTLASVEADDAAAEPAAAAVPETTEQWDAPEDAAAEQVQAGGAAGELLSEAGERLSAGDADAAAAKCRAAIEIAPDLVAAYSMLGMAEEQRGNTVAAAGAYRRVLQLDPDRRVEREKLELLYAEGAATPPDEYDEGTDDRIVTWAPWVAAIGAAFVVMTILTFVGLRVHAAGAAEEKYTEQMRSAQAALDGREYGVAARAFEEALAVRPDDEDAKRGLRYAQRKMTSASRVTGAPAPTAVAQQGKRQAPILPSRGPNVFSPIPIGPERAQQGAEPEPATGQPPQTRTQTQSTRPTAPPSMSGERVEVTRDRPTTTTPDDGIMPFDQVLDEPAQEPRESIDEPEAAEETQEPEEPRGEITITLSQGPRTQDDGADAPTQPATDSGHADRAYDLRRQAQAAIGRGNCEQAKQLLDQAIEQYQADTEANPAKRQANQAAIATCRTLRQQCEAGEDQ